MGKIKKYQQGAPLSTVNTRRIDLAGVEGQLISSVSSKLFSAGVKLNQQHQQARNNKYVKDLTLQFDNDKERIMQDFSVEFGHDPMREDLPTILQGRLTEHAESLLKEPPTSAAADTFKGIADETITGAVGEWGQFAQKKNVENVVNGVNQDKSEIFALAEQASDPASIPKFRGRGALSASSARGVVDQGQLDQIAADIDTGVVYHTAKGMINGNRLSEAKKLINDEEYIKILGSKAYGQLSDLIKRRQQVLNNKMISLEALKFNNPWKYLDKTEGRPPFSLPDFFGDNATNALEGHNAWLNEMTEKHGLNAFNLPFLHPNDLKRFEQELLTQDVDDTVNQLVFLDHKVPPDIKARVGRDMFMHNKPLGIAMSIAGDGAEAAQAAEFIVQGQNLLKTEQGKNSFKKFAAQPPSKRMTQMVVDNYLGTTLDDPQTRVALTEAVTSYVVGKKFREGDLGGDYTDSEIQDAMNDIIGPVFDYNGIKTIGFRGPDGTWIGSEGIFSGFTTDDFEETVDSLTADEIKSVYKTMPLFADKSEMSVDQLRDAMLIKESDSGYSIFFGTGIMQTKDGNKFILDFNKILKNRTGK